MRLPQLHFSVDGAPVPASWTQAAADLRGYSSAALTIPQAYAQLAGAQQGSVVRGVTEGGRVAWEGRLALDPLYASGLAALSCRGYIEEAELRGDRVLFQSADPSVWSDATAPPFSLPVGIAGDISTGAGTVTITSTAAGTVKLAAWFGGHVGGLTRYAWTRVAGTANITTQGAVGPSGTLTTIATETTTTVDRTLGTNAYDMLELEVAFAAAGTVVLSNLRVNGIGTTDVYLSSDVVRELGRRLGYDTTGVQDASTNVLPYDVSGIPWSQALDDMASIEDWRVLVLDDRGKGPYLDFGPFGTTSYDIRRDRDTDASQIGPLPKYNQVTVTYSDETGSPRSITVAAQPDPLARYGLTRSYLFSLPGTQSSPSLAQAVAQKLIARVSQARYQGRLKLYGMRQGLADVDAFAVLPGDELVLADFGPAGAQRLRVFEVELDPGGVTVGIEQPASVASMIAKGRFGARTAPVVEISSTPLRSRQISTSPTSTRTFVVPPGFDLPQPSRPRP